MSANEPLERAEELLRRLEETRAEVDRLAESDDADAAIEALTRLQELAREVHEELARAKRAADAGA